MSLFENNSTSSTGSAKTSDSMLKEYFIDSLKDIYWAEKHLVESLPKLMEAASSIQLQDAVEYHLQQTEEHVSRLEEVFSLLGEEPEAVECKAMAGLTEEADTIIEETEEGTATRDVALITAAQKVEHYEIATYGSLVQLAKTLGLTQVADILSITLGEEKDTDTSLSEIAENGINYEAVSENQN